jgi:hypothetical protein
MPLIQCTLQLCKCDDAAVSSNVRYVSDMEIMVLTSYNTLRCFKVQQPVCSVESSGCYIKIYHNGSNLSLLYFYRPGDSLY